MKRMWLLVGTIMLTVRRKVSPYARVSRKQNPPYTYKDLEVNCPMSLVLLCRGFPMFSLSREEVGTLLLRWKKKRVPVGT